MINRKYYWKSVSGKVIWKVALDYKTSEVIAEVYPLTILITNKEKYGWRIYSSIPSESGRCKTAEQCTEEIDKRLSKLKIKIINESLFNIK